MKFHSNNCEKMLEEDPMLNLSRESKLELEKMLKKSSKKVDLQILTEEDTLEDEIRLDLDLPGE